MQAKVIKELSTVHNR